MKLEGRAHTWRFPRQAAQGIPTAVNLRALHSLHFLGPEGADSVHLSRRGAGWGGGGAPMILWSILRIWNGSGSETAAVPKICRSNMNFCKIHCLNAFDSLAQKCGCVRTLQCCG